MCIRDRQQSACLFFLLKETKAAPEKQDRNDLPGKDEHHDYYFKETGRRSKDQRIKEKMCIRDSIHIIQKQISRQ